MAGLSMILNNKRHSTGIFLACTLWLLAAGANGDEFQYRFDGQSKGRLVGQAFPANSAFKELFGATALDVEFDLRLNFEAQRNKWSTSAAYQLIGLYGDPVDFSGQLSQAGVPGEDRLPDDRRRLFDLTKVLHDDGRLAALHRLDRLWLAYTGDKAVIRIGRQAITWGNGIYFSPMDIVNPFDPTAIDTEYKPGDDMLYAQFLLNNGHDIQGSVVVRRNPLTGAVASNESTTSLKYHGSTGDSEFDILLARSYGEPTIGIGSNRSIGGAVWRGDLVISRNNSVVTAQLVTNLNYSWTWQGKNMSGVVEYYFNGFGISGGTYDALTLAAEPELLDRVGRGELFALGRHYIAGGIAIEMSPLWTLTPGLYTNLNDPSALVQIVTQFSLANNLTFLGALGFPIGPEGTEYGGIEAAVPGRFFSSDASVFAQIAWYF
jgi:hypothetical protein